MAPDGAEALEVGRLEAGGPAAPRPVCSPRPGTGPTGGRSRPWKVMGVATARWAGAPSPSGTSTKAPAAIDLRVVQHVGGRVHRRPPHVVAVEALGQLVAGPRAKTSSSSSIRAARRGAGRGRWRTARRSSRSGRSIAVARASATWRSASTPSSQNQRCRRPSGSSCTSGSSRWCAAGRAELAEAQLDAEVPPDAVDAGAQQRRLDQLAPAGALALEQRGEDAGDRRACR